MTDNKPALKSAHIYETIEQARGAIVNTERYKAIQVQIKDYIAKAEMISITDEFSLKHADGLLSEMKQFAKEIDEKGLEARRPYSKTASVIKEAFDEITGSMHEVTPIIQKKVVAFLKEEAIRKEAEAKERKKELDTLKAWSSRCSAEIMKADSQEELTEVFNKFIKPFKKDLFKLLDEQTVTTAFSHIKDLGKIRHGHLTSVANNDPTIIANKNEEAQELVEQIAIAVEEIQEEVLPEVPAMKINTSIRKTVGWALWKTEAEVGREFLSPDPKKIKAYIDLHREDLKKSLDKVNGKLIYGIKFLYEESASTR